MNHMITFCFYENTSLFCSLKPTHAESLTNNNVRHEMENKISLKSVALKYIYFDLGFLQFVQ